ncbi:MAG: ABC transporter ATP-binding protein [Oscillospiraceae bacterium]|nr:ABC transporter ATP-binding protein [Oscillospiraceae bacterium]
MIEVYHVSKQYLNNINVVNDVTFTVEKNQIYGLLGPNGAGKTTLMQMIATLLKPTSGTITVCGMNTMDQAREIHRHIGFLTSEVRLDPYSTPNKLFDFFGKLYGLSSAKIRNKKAESFERFGIGPFTDKKIVELSTGMKQKISIAISLIHDPPVVIFDEPTNGLDILTAYQVTEYLRELGRSGHAVLLSTHIFSVAESLCDKMAVIIDGRIVAEGDIPEINAQAGAKSFEKSFLNLYKAHHKE